MAVAKLTAPVPTGMTETITKITECSNAAADANRNVRSGPTTLKKIGIDNTILDATASWVKIYNVVDDSFVAGTSKPVIVIPVAAVGTSPAAGLVDIDIPGGLFFPNGISILASKEGGDTMTDAPFKQLDTTLVTD